jgi:hypothetical protein
MPGTERRPRPAGATARQQQLRRLDAALRRFRERLAHIGQGIEALRAVETVRPLTPPEAREAARLNLESEGLRLELEGLRREFTEAARRKPEHAAGYDYPAASQAVR